MSGRAALAFHPTVARPGQREEGPKAQANRSESPFETIVQRGEAIEASIGLAQSVEFKSWSRLGVW